ncbi:MAG TPA: ABC transporter permease, partial [Firmicutes bacterium]|nr:ABC transporter permease [Bacillota bacterium]
MAVFKAYFKVMRGSALILAVNLFIFMGLALLFSFVAPGVACQEFEPARTPLAVIDRDGEPLARGLVDYLATNFKLVPRADDEEELQDALFYRKVEYIAIIPPGFSASFMKDGDGVIRKIVVPDSTSSRYVDLAIDRFLNTVRLHRVYGREKSTGHLVAAAREDLAYDTPVTIGSSGGAVGYGQGYYYYFNYCAYALLAMIITGISSIMLAFNKIDLYRRNLAAPLSRRSLNLQIAAGHAVFALGCWALLLISAFALHGKSLLSSGLVGLYSLNTLAFALVSAAIGFLAGTFV